MAETAVNFAIEILGSLLQQEINLLGGVKKIVEGIKSELESLRSFLKDADARAASEEFGGGGNEGVKTWVKQLREEAYNIEDVIDEYMLAGSKLPHGSGLVLALRKIISLIKRVKMRHGVASEIAGIKSSLADIKRRAESYSFRSTDEGTSGRTRINVVPHDSRVGSFFIEDDEVVGIETTRGKLTDWLVNGTSQRSVVAVVGEGGLGKTTLAGKLFNNEAVKSHFDFQAWVTVGKEYKKNDLLRTIIREFHGLNQESVPGGLDKMEEKDLISNLRVLLKDKTYLVVLDDVWKIDFWRDVEHAILDNNKSSRILLTTRRMNVADFCRTSSFVQIHELETLDPNDAWKLFCRKAFGPSSGGYCPSELKELSQDILAKCGGLPLAIVAVCGLLSTKKKVVSEWKISLDGLGSRLGSDPHLKDCNRVLSEGYYDLPLHLKSCLLYFGLFPESCKINCARLKRLWMAEGFVPYSKRPTSEQFAEEYLNELIDRSLVQVSEREISGRARICLVHDLMYEIIVRKAIDLGFCRVLDEDNLSHYSNTRRISVHKNTMDVSERIKDSKVRSVVLFSLGNLPVSFMNAILDNFKLMKVLDLENSPIDYLPKEVGNLFLLHYLSVKNTQVKIIPKSIGKLLHLETLDMKHSLVSELPVEIQNLKKLRYLVAYNFEDTGNTYGGGAKIPEGIGSLIDLQKLCFVQANSKVLKELRKLRQLRKLGIRLINGNGTDLCALIANLENLESLAIAPTSRDEPLDIQPLTTPPQYLQRLYLMGNVNKLPHWILKLENLIKIGLDLSGLTEDPLEVLHSLPNLFELRYVDAYNYERLHFKEGWFPKLQRLLLWDFKAVKSMIIEEGAMPNIREFWIKNCPLLMEIPSGIEHLRNLKLLQFKNMLRQVYCMMKEEKWEKATKHIPEILVFYRKAGELFYCTSEYLSSLWPEDVEQLVEKLN